MSDKAIIVFDFGGVLLDWNPRHLYRKLFDGDDQAMEAFLQEVDFYAWNHQQDMGRSFAEGVADLSAKYPHRASLIAAFADRWEETLAGPIQETVEILETLKQQAYPLYGLTNWSAETFHRIRPEHDFMDWFEDIVVSGEVGLAKPDRAIYQVLLQRVEAPAERCLFIDDSAANIAAAHELGFRTIHYQSPPQLNGELAARGLLLPAAGQ
jgi:2-haloacid dehalogenase